MHAASLSDWVAFLSLGVGIGALVAIPFVGWVKADYWLVDDWQPVRDRVTNAVANAKYDAREAYRRAAVTAAALLLLLAAPHSPEASR
ncbi:hypothetical protein [Streptomyces sp. NPDC093060]|uniref:hypothetical protein n=1 Tax=Streptomyces sp. NPDC093060 TaxID=3366019 RepID=UPI00381B764E